MNIRPAEASELSAVFALRYEVFVEEQHVPPEEELDGHDTIARHYIAEDDGRTVVGCARVIEEDGCAHIGRLAVKQARRGEGIGAMLCRQIIADCRARGCHTVWLNSQLHAIGFYERLGFRAEGAVFLDAGIEHRRMELVLCAGCATEHRHPI